MAGRGIVYFVEADTGRKITFQWNGKDLTGWTGVVHVRSPNGQVVTKTGTLTSGGPPGIFEFEFLSGDLTPDDGVLQPMEFELTDPSADNTTIPSRPNSLFLVVRRQIA